MRRLDGGKDVAPRAGFMNRPRQAPHGRDRGNPRSVGGAPGGAGPYVTGVAHPGWRARWHARGARAGSFAKSLPREPRKLPRGLANPWRLPALHHLASAREEKGARAYPAPENKEHGRRSVGYARL